MKQAFRWIVLLAFGGAAFIALQFSLKYLFGSMNLLSIFFGLCGLVVIIKVGNWVARLVGLDPYLKKGQHWWYDWHA